MVAIVMWLCQLQCGHPPKATAGFPPEWMPCPECEIALDAAEVETKLYAIECREYRAKCYQCRFSRYTGQDKSLAGQQCDRHALTHGGHEPVVEYVTIDEKRTKVRSVYGRRVKILIEGIPRVSRVQRKISGPNEPPF